MSTSVTLEFLGTGTSQGVPVIGCNCEVCCSTDTRDRRLRSSVLISTSGVQMVIDTGPDFRQQMLRSQTTRFDAVLYTHEHADHIMGLDDIRAINFQQHLNMPLYATQRVETVIRSVFHYAFSAQPYPGVPQVHFRRVGQEPFDVLGVAVVPIHAMHGSMPVTGYRIGEITYLTDVKAISATELDKVRGSRVVVLNALRTEPHHSHLSLSDALELMAELQPETGYLTHISHLLGTHREVATALPQNVKLAYDGLVVTV